ncbi:uncharacterized protein WCC33_000777 [Rhinophrynus dorsalis]
MCIVLEQLRTNHIYVKLEKCLFHQTSLSFLGYVVSPARLAIDPEKVTAVRDWPIPLGFANYYRRLILNFSKVIQPIVALTRKGPDPSNWSEEAKASFSVLKTAFCSAPVLQYPDPLQPFTLEVDASETTAGAVLPPKISNYW